MTNTGKLLKSKAAERKKKQELEDALKRKRTRSSYASLKGDFAENQESHIVEDGGFIQTKAQNGNKLPKLSQESFAHIQDQKSDKSAEEELSSSSSSDSLANLFESKLISK